MSTRADKYPISMEELRKTCPLVEIDVIADGKGGDILIGRAKGEIQVRIPCKKVTKAAVKLFQERYAVAVDMGILKPAAATPKPARTAVNVVPIDTAGKLTASGDEVPVEEEPEA